MLRCSLTIPLVLLAVATCAQPFAIGTRSITFTDEVRNRAIACTIHYPATISGTTAPVADGVFPVLVHGHGFVMGVDAYTNLRDHFAPRGYILVLPTTEGGFAPDHNAFGLDLAYLASAMQVANTDATSPFFGKVVPATALMGHSMGGGASFLGAAGNSSIQALVNFAPAETNPSAIAAAGLVDVPTLVFAATEDCVTPAATNQTPMYDAVPVPCKAFVDVIGGGHCYFGASSFTCSFGELTCAPDLTISREQQHAIVNDFAGLWLDHFLKGDAGALSAFRDSVLLSDRVLAETTCITTAVSIAREIGMRLSPVPVSTFLHIDGLPPNTDLEVYDGHGTCILRSPAAQGILDVTALPNGVYHVRSSDGSARFVGSFVVAH